MPLSGLPPLESAFDPGTRVASRPSPALDTVTVDDEQQPVLASRRSPDSRPGLNGLADVLRVIRQELLSSLGFRSRRPPHYPSSPTPGQTAGEVLAAIRQGKTQDPAAVRQSIGDGVAQARRIFAQSGLPPATIEQGAGKVEKLLDKGLQLLQADAEQLPERLEASAERTVYRRKERSSLEITTQEGDRVRIDVRSKENFRQSSLHVSDGTTEITQESVRVASRTRIVLKINGDLNDAERTAIDALVAQVDLLADEFFTSGAAEAFANASALEFDTEQLAQYSLKLRLSERMRYERIALSIAPANQIDPQTAPLGQLQDVASTQPGGNLIEPPHETVEALPTPTEEPVAATQQSDASGQLPNPGVDEQQLRDLIGTFVRQILDQLAQSANASELRIETSAKLKLLRTVVNLTQQRDYPEHEEATSLFGGILERLAEGRGDDD